jgi:glutathione synthase/RimK-type ligase-like ATP-grasp enzyme
MVQPYLPAIADEGELSFVFIDGALSHALRKRPARGDYRIQSLYGGTEEAHAPSPEEVSTARAVLAALPAPAPLYARIDMVRADDGALLLMEAELIEPYLYPEQGPQLGSHLAQALAKRLQI